MGSNTSQQTDQNSNQNPASANGNLVDLDNVDPEVMKEKGWIKAGSQCTSEDYNNYILSQGYIKPDKCDCSANKNNNTDNTNDTNNNTDNTNDNNTNYTDNNTDNSNTTDSGSSDGKENYCHNCQDDPALTKLINILIFIGIMYFMLYIIYFRQELNKNTVDTSSLPDYETI